MKLKRFNKKIDKFDYSANIASSLMFIVSAVITVMLYVEDGFDLLSQIIFFGMGSSIEIAKVLFLILTGFFILKNKYKIAVITGIFSLLLVGVSIFANYQYATNIDNREVESNKIETRQYKELIEQKNKINNDLKSLNNDKESYQKELNNFEKSINEQSELKNTEIAKYTSIWAKNEASNSYDNEINRLQNEKDKSQNLLNETNKSIKESDKKLDIINDKLDSTKQYENTIQKGLEGKKIRVILGILFEVIAIMLFFMNLIRKNTLLIEKEGYQDPQAIFENAINNMMVDVTKVMSTGLQNQVKELSNNVIYNLDKKENLLDNQTSKIEVNSTPDNSIDLEQKKVNLSKESNELENVDSILYDSDRPKLKILKSSYIAKLENKNSLMDDKIHDIEENKNCEGSFITENENKNSLMDDNLLDNKLFKTKELSNENISKYLEFARDNIKDDETIPGIKSISENIDISYGEGQRIYKHLLKTGKLEKINNFKTKVVKEC